MEFRGSNLQQLRPPIPQVSLLLVELPPPLLDPLLLLLDELDGGGGDVLLAQHLRPARAVQPARVLQQRLLHVHEQLGHVHRVETHLNIVCVLDMSRYCRYCRYE